MIGDGLLSLVDPKRHCLLWEIGPQWCREMVDEFAEHPNIARGAGLVELVAERAGRIVFDGFPTGVAVTHGQHHGGPYPACSNPLHTSVGATAIRRWLRPLAFQNAPAQVLPPELADDNPLRIWRRVDGELTRDPLSGAGGSGPPA